MDSSKKLKTEPNMGKTFQIQFKLSFLVPHPHPTPTPTPTHMLQCEDVKCSSWILTICISFFVYYSFHFFQSFTWLKTGYILLVYDWKLNYLLDLFVKITVLYFRKINSETTNATMLVYFFSSWFWYHFWWWNLKWMSLDWFWCHERENIVYCHI